MIMKRLPFCFLICVLTLFGCNRNYTIVCESNNEDWGSVTGGGEYGRGKIAILTATPSAGYYFLGWQDGDVSNPRTVTVSGDATYTALFGDTPFGEFDGKPVHISGKICNDQVWPDLGLDIDYIIDGTLTIGCNATVRVMPNVTIMFSGADGNIEVVENGALNMVGTERIPIILRGQDDYTTPGSWGRVVVNTTRNENAFLYVDFHSGGSSEDLHGGVVNVRGKLSMMCCLIDGSNGSGLVTEEGSTLTTFAYNTIQNCAGYPWVTSDFPSLYKGDNVGNYLFYQGSMNPSFVYIDLDHFSINESVVLPNILPVWYYFPHGFYFDGNGSITLDETQVLVGGGKQLKVGKNLNFNATGDYLYVAFATLSVDEPWGGMVFESERTDNNLQWCWFKYCGTNNNGYCLKVTENAKLSLYNCDFGPCGKYGVWIENIGTWGNVTHANINTHECPKLAHIEHGGIYNGQTYADNTDLDQLP